jgi:hypothetical protein
MPPKKAAGTATTTTITMTNLAHRDNEARMVV